MKRVLVVDGDPHRRVFMVQLLIELGFRVLMAGTAAEALGILASLSARVDAVIVSPVLPDLSGALLASEVVAGYPGRRVLLTGGGDEPVPAGVGTLSKPLTRDKLLAALIPYPA